MHIITVVLFSSVSSTEVGKQQSWLALVTVPYPYQLIHQPWEPFYFQHWWLH